MSFSRILARSTGDAGDSDPKPMARRPVAPAQWAALAHAPEVQERELQTLRYACRTRRHSPGRFQPARFLSFKSNGVSKPPRERLISPRPVSTCAIWRNISAVLCLADTSATI